MNNDCTICDIEGSATLPTRPTDYPTGAYECGNDGIENFKGHGRHGTRWRRGWRNWRGGYRGFGYNPYWYGSHYYSPLYYDYPYVSRQPVLAGTVRNTGNYGINTITFTIAMLALIFAFFALKK